MKEKFRRRLIVREMQNPDDCFCEEKELNPVRDYDNDPIVSYSDEWIHPNYGKIEKQPFRKCQICGKAYYAGVIIA